MEDQIVIYQSEQQRAIDQWWTTEGQVMVYNFLVDTVSFLVYWYIVGFIIALVGKIVYDICRKDWGGLKELNMVAGLWPILLVMYSGAIWRAAMKKNWIKKIING